MKREEVKQLIETTFLYRPYYRATFKSEEEITKLVDEWLDKLQEYEYKDIKERLDGFFRDNESKLPTPYDLTKDARTIAQKERKGRSYIYCDVCHKPLEVFIDRERQKINRFEADKHIDRCHSVRYLQQLYRKWWKREIPYDEVQNLREMSQDRFMEVYWQILKKAYNMMEDGSQEKWYAYKALESNGRL